MNNNHILNFLNRNKPLNVYPIKQHLYLCLWNDFCIVINNHCTIYDHTPLFNQSFNDIMTEPGVYITTNVENAPSQPTNYTIAILGGRLIIHWYVPISITDILKFVEQFAVTDIKIIGCGKLACIGWLTETSDLNNPQHQLYNIGSDFISTYLKI